MDLSAHKGEIIQLALRLTLATAITFFSIKWLMNKLDPSNKGRERAKASATKLLKRLKESGNTSISFDNFNEYELMIAGHLVHPDDISVTWGDIAGLDDVIRELRETVIVPVKNREIFKRSKLSAPPKGVLMHGPPGCGKTMIAKATAKEAGMNFINLDVSVLTDKWYGESQKFAAALFSLAVKIQPCIIFIDEIDSFLRSRSATDHEATAMMKAQFMQWWDGLVTDPDCLVIIIGATNRPNDLDRAILRRMPVTLTIGLPNQTQREVILKKILSKEPCTEDVDYSELARKTDRFAGSDLMEVCRSASIYRMREFICSRSLEEPDEANLRPLSMEDLVTAADKIRQARILTGSIRPYAPLDVE